MKVRKQQCGFTLIEIAIVLLIIGLLLGGVMKGQAMIDSARVRSLANDLTGIEAAWISFQDRYRSLPGDYGQAKTHILAEAANGDANAVVDAAESGDVWQHLSAAGFISGSYNGEDTCAVASCPSNPFNGFYEITNSANAMGFDVAGHELSTGGNIPVAVMYELDLKMDDGVPNTGRLQAFGEACVENNQWDVVEGSSDCVGVLRLPL
jgi:prepilin-type N-terminal cleavage/methylation domain-containing protein